MVQDLRFAFRLLARKPGVTVTAVLLLAFGIAGSTAVFSLIHGILLQPLPGVQDPERLVQFLRVEGGRTTGNFGYPDYLDFRDQARLFHGVAAEAAATLSLATGKTERVRGAVVSGNYFSVLSVKPAAGRLIAPEDDPASGAQWASVISHGLWQRSYGADPAVVGKTIRVNAHDFTIVGVAAPDFHGMALGVSTDVWLPMALQPIAIPRLSSDILHDRTAGWISIYARRKPGVTMEAARTEIKALADRFAEQYPNTNRGHAADVAGDVGLYAADRKSLENFLGLLFAAVETLLLIACCNVANLLLAQAAARRREMAVRFAMGAGRARVARQLIAESSLLCVMATAAGWLLSRWGLDLLTNWLVPYERLLQSQPKMDLTTFGFAALSTVLTALLLGLGPALTTARGDLATAFKEAAPASGLQRSRLIRGLVIAQVALSLMLMVGAGLISKTLMRIVQANQGFDPQGVLVASLDLSTLDYSEDRTRSLVEQLHQRMSALPGVLSASLAKTYPALGWADGGPVFYEGQEPPQEEIRRQSNIGIRVQSNAVSPDYFGTLRIPILAGRDFGPQDTAGAPLVCIVGKKLAERLWPGVNPVGKRIAVPTYNGPRRPPLEIVGVVADVKYRSLITDAPLFLYVPLLQNHEVFISLQLRTKGDMAAVSSQLAAEVAGVDPNLPIYQAQSLNEQIQKILWQQRAAAVLIALFGALSLLVASVGLYSVMAKAVSQRTREIGIRVALGAQSRDVVRLVLRGGMLIVGLGMAIGICGALALRRLFSTFLYGVSATDPATFVSVWLILTAVSLAACYLPARAASRVDPVQALHHE